jgi:hypothetical protein
VFPYRRLTFLRRCLCSASFDPAAPGECTGAEFARFLDAEGEPEAGDAAATALDALSLAALAAPTAAAADA